MALYIHIFRLLALCCVSGIGRSGDAASNSQSAKSNRTEKLALRSVNSNAIFTHQITQMLIMLCSCSSVIGHLKNHLQISNVLSRYTHVVVSERRTVHVIGVFNCRAWLWIYFWMFVLGFSEDRNWFNVPRLYLATYLICASCCISGTGGSLYAAPIRRPIIQKRQSDVEMPASNSQSP